MPPKKNSKGKASRPSASNSKKSSPNRIKRIEQPAQSVAVALSYSKKKTTYMDIRANPNMSMVRIRGREPMQLVTGTVDFQLLTDEYVTPLNVVLFPKLSVEASLYDKFRFRSLSLEYEPRCSATTAGQVGLLVLPDVHESEAPANMTELERYEHSNAVPLWQEGKTGFDWTHNSLIWYFTAPADEFTSSTQGTRRTQAQGVVQVAVQDCATGSLGGMVYVNYDVELCERRPPYDSGFTESIPAVNQVGQGPASDVHVPLNAISQLIGPPTGAGTFWGNPSAFISKLPESLYRLGGGTPSYVAAIGAGTLALARWMILHPKTSGRMLWQYALGAVTTPLRDRGSVSSTPPRGSRKSSLSKPSLRRQTCDSKELEYEALTHLADPPLPVPWALDVREDGLYCKWEPDSDWVLYEPPSTGKLVPTANNDYTIDFWSYNPVTDATGHVIVASGNSASAVTGNYITSFTSNLAYPTYFTVSYGTVVATGSSRLAGPNLLGAFTDDTASS